MLFPFRWDTMPLLLQPIRAQAPVKSPPRTYASNSAIRLPIQIDDRTRTGLSELKLYVRAPGADWVCAQTAPAGQTLFDYRGEKDGEYSFMFVTVDKSGRASPANLDSRPPHQIFIVDTVKPVLRIQPLPIAKNGIFLQCQMDDANPDLSSIKMEYLGGDNQWRPLEIAHADTPGVFNIPQTSVLEGKVRASAKDRAGNAGYCEVDLGDATTSYKIASKPPVSFREPGELPKNLVKPDSQFVLPADVRENTTIQMGHTNPIKSAEPMTLAVPDSEAKPVAAVGYNPIRTKPVEKADPVTIPDPAPPLGNAGPNTSAKVDPFLPQIDANVPQPRPEPVAVQPARTEPQQPLRMDLPQPENQQFPGPAVSGTHRIINTNRCTLDYAVENVFVGGQVKMEFWATRDGGRSWNRLTDDSGGRSPARLTLPGDGLYGIRIKANGNGQPPQGGEAPDGWVEVDTLAPTVRLLPPIVGAGADTGTLTVQWMVHDKNLAPDSINLFHASRPDGPWLPIASGLRNDGSYRWLIPSGVGTEVYLRLEAMDRAGNKGGNDLRDPVPMPQPKVKFIDINAAR